jgi:hypothetical protein
VVIDDLFRPEGMQQGIVAIDRTRNIPAGNA